jgi:hypothetical protein
MKSSVEQNNIYLLDKLVKVTICDAEVERLYCSKKEIKIFGIVFRKEGVYWRYLSHNFISEGAPENCFIDGENIYYNPRVKLDFGNRVTATMYFESIVACHNYVAFITKGKNIVTTI